MQRALRAIIETRILDHPRSQQQMIGASELGMVCQRKLAFKLSGIAGNPETPAWRPTVGTALHTWAEAAVQAENKRLGWDRWLTEMPIVVGHIDGEPVPGHGDLYDLLTGTVVDWKFPGVTTIRNARRAGHPGQQYEVQAHLYGKGYRMLGLKVTTVAVYFLPAAGELSEGYFWSAPFDESIADRYLARAAGVKTVAAHLGWDNAIAAMPMSADHCAHCPWWEPGAERRDRCPGADIGGARNPDPSRPLFGAVAPTN